MTDTYEHCSCGAREKYKCSKESTPIDGVRYGKMCVKELKAERQEALADPNTISVEDTFKHMFDNYKDILEELSGK